MKFPSKSVASGHIAMLIFSLLVSGSFVLGSIIANLIDPLEVVFSNITQAHLCVSLESIGEYVHQAGVQVLQVTSPVHLLNHQIQCPHQLIFVNDCIQHVQL